MSKDVVKDCRELTMKTGAITEFQINNIKYLAMVLYGGPTTITIVHRDISGEFDSKFPLLSAHKHGDVKFLVPGGSTLMPPDEALRMLKEGVAAWLGPKWDIEVIFNDISNESAPKRQRRKRTKTVRAKRKAAARSKNKR